MSTTMTAAGVRKAAVLLIQLGRDKAAVLLSQFTEAEVEAVSAEIAHLGTLSSTEAQSVLSEFSDLMTARANIAQGGLAFAQDLLQESLGAERAAEILNRLNAVAIQMPFQFLHRADPAQLRSFIVDEHPQVIALVLAHMTPDSASLLLAGLDPERLAEVAHRIAVMDRTSPEIIQAVETTLEHKLSSMLQSSEMFRVGGVDPLVDIINRSDRSTERLIVEGLESRDPALAEEIKSHMFMFEDIVHLDDRSIQQLLRQVETVDLATALKGVAGNVMDKITVNLSSSAAADILEEIQFLGPVRTRQVEEAQQKIIRTIRQLEEQGQITVHRGADDEFVV